MNTEMSFLFSKDYLFKYEISNNPTDPNLGTLWEEPVELSNSGYTVYKDASAFKAGTTDIKNYIKQNIYDKAASNTNPYISLLKDSAFKYPTSKMLSAADFTYLRDLGVYPINRLIILRRYPEGTIVHDNLDDIPDSPISTVIGWVKEDSEIFNINFKEIWETNDRYLHEVLYDILKNEFKLDIKNAIPSPGFTQGLLFGFLKNMGLVADDSSAYDIPFGDPNLLREAATRDYNKQGLQSNMTIDFETVYEQKFVGDYDPALAMIDIIGNLTKMGTSDTRFIFSKDSSILKKISTAASGKGNQLNLWADVVSEIVDKFIKAITETIKGIIDANPDSAASSTESEQDTQKYEYTKDQQATIDQINADRNDELNSTGFWSGKPKTEEEKVKINEKYDALIEDVNKNSKLKEDTVNQKIEKGMASFNSQLNILTSNFLSSVVAATFAKHRWPIRSSIGAMTGLPTAPWHITIGNPWSPIISSGNMIVDNITVSSKSEMGFNDMPIQLTAKIQVKFGRNLGGQEIRSIFNNGYKRAYTYTDETIK